VIDDAQDGTPTRRSFQHLPSEIGAEEAEEIGVEHLLRDIKDQTVSTLAERVSTKLNSLRGLKSRLDEIYQYRKPSLTSAPPSANVCAPGFGGRPNDEASKANGLLPSSSVYQDRRSTLLTPIVLQSTVSNRARCPSTTR
jgi:hypothetical protein